MQVEVDQSWKIERSGKATILAFSNHQEAAIKIPKDVKREAFVYLEDKFGRTKLNIFRIFAAGAILLIKKAGLSIRNLSLLIDKEYPGREDEIRSMILEAGRKADLVFDPKLIHFVQVGKKSGAHFIAYGVHIGKRKAEFTAELQEITELLPWNKKKTEGRSTRPLSCFSSVTMYTGSAGTRPIIL